MSSKNYFDEEYVKKMLYEYQRRVIARYEIKITGRESVFVLSDTEEYKKYKALSSQLTEKDEKIKIKLIRIMNEDKDFKDLENKITVEIQKIVKAIIYRHKFTIFEPFDDLFQVAMLNCFPNYLKFHEDKGSAFDYFSLIAKRSLLNYTTRRKKQREVQSIEEKINIKSPNYNDNFEISVESMGKEIKKIIDENFLGKKRKKYQIICEIIVDYLMKNKSYVGKSDLYKFASVFGMRNIDIREFSQNIKRYYPNICEMLKEEIDDENYSIENLEEDSGEV